MFRSPSSRRAWIEIRKAGVKAELASVALLAEGVDRNCYVSTDGSAGGMSPSSRRAWIEISYRGRCGGT